MKKLLPLGSVVTTKENPENVMIIARMVRNIGKEVYDYCACAIPKGVIDKKCLSFFNHEDVNRLLFIGYQNEEEIAYNYALCIYESKFKEENVK